MRTARLFSYLVLFFCLISFAGNAQKTKVQLQKEKAENLRKIKKAEQILSATEKEKSVSIGQLNALKYQIDVREKLIRGIKSEIGLLDDEIEFNLEIIDALENDLKVLKEEYSAMLYAAHKASKGYGQLTFLFSSKSFNQLFRRIEYMKQYGTARKKQVDQINKVKGVLADENINIKEKRIEQEDLLGDQVSENKKLLILKNKESQIVLTLASRETELKNELQNRRVALAALDNLIADIIKKEAEADMLASKKKSLVGGNFEKNKLRLPWPTQGFVSQKFGKSRDPILKNVERDSPGIEIQTDSNAEALAVYDGTVTAVVSVSGFNKTVIVRHGDFLTVYAKLEKVFVKKGQELKTGDKVGGIYTNSEGLSELHFQVWKQGENTSSKLDPEKWLARK